MLRQTGGRMDEWTDGQMGEWRAGRKNRPDADCPGANSLKEHSLTVYGKPFSLEASDNSVTNVSFTKTEMLAP
jgi:hypothetical protein